MLQTTVSFLVRSSHFKFTLNSHFKQVLMGNLITPSFVISIDALLHRQKRQGSSQLVSYSIGFGVRNAKCSI